jgi:hypothetical protein
MGVFKGKMGDGLSPDRPGDTTTMKKERKKERKNESVNEERAFCSFGFFFFFGFLFGAPDLLSHGAGKLIMRSTD